MGLGWKSGAPGSRRGAAPGTDPAPDAGPGRNPSTGPALASRAPRAHLGNLTPRQRQPSTMDQQGGDSRRITIHSPEDFAGMRRAGQLAAETLDMITPHVRPGVTTAELDRLCHEHILAAGATPAPLGYRGYP